MTALTLMRDSPRSSKVSPDESKDFERAVSNARERIEDLSALLVVANDLDHQADVILDDEGNRVS
jgi:hypothetical protein